MKKITESKEFEGLENKAYRYKWNNRNWSDWGLLFRFLVVICKLLEEKVVKPKETKEKRKPSAWQTFLGEQLRVGKTIQEAAQNWKAKKQSV